MPRPKAPNIPDCSASKEEMDFLRNKLMMCSTFVFFYENDEYSSPFHYKALHRVSVYRCSLKLERPSQQLTLRDRGFHVLVRNNDLMPGRVNLFNQL